MTWLAALRRRAPAAVFGWLMAGFAMGTILAGAGSAAAPVRPDDPPVLAHYYIWYEESSWNRAKTDFPMLGLYSSDQSSIMREHVRLAKSIGIDGFIVSWKSTEVLDPRLEALLEIASEEDFFLAITYQGLDFERKPLPTHQIELELDYFRDNYADHPAFDLFDKPLVALTGTWELNRNELAKITVNRRDDLYILATEKNVEGYERIADLVDGDLYYWSSVDPNTFPDYPQKLIEMATAVEARGGLWVAPVAPGFDAREVGGETVVDRDGGRVLRKQWNGAMASLPDVVGLISWNEFSENTHIEPSQQFGNTYAQVVAELTSSKVPATIDFDSSGPEGPNDQSPLVSLAPVIGLVVLMSGMLFRVVRRSRASNVVNSKTQAPPVL